MRLAPHVPLAVTSSVKFHEGVQLCKNKVPTLVARTRKSVKNFFIINFFVIACKGTAFFGHVQEFLQKSVEIYAFSA